MGGQRAMQSDDSEADPNKQAGPLPRSLGSGGGTGIDYQAAETLCDAPLCPHAVKAAAPVH